MAFRYTPTFLDGATGRPYGVRFANLDSKSQALADERLLSMSLRFSTSQISTVQVALRESVSQKYGFEFGNITAPVFDSNPNAALIDVRAKGRALNMQVSGVQIAPNGKTVIRTVDGQSLGARRLTKNNDPSLMRNVPYTTWVKSKVESLGLQYYGEMDAATAYEAGVKDGEDAWTAIQRMAKQLGFIAYEASGYFVFGRPSWLASHLAKYEVTWSPDDKENDGLLELPTIRTSAADGKTTVSLRLAPGIDDFFPGGGLILKGVPGYERRYIVTDVSFDVALDGVVTVEAETPVDPVPTGVPQPPPELANAQANYEAALAGAGGYTFTNPGSGFYGGSSLTAEQVTNAVGIARAAAELGFVIPVAARLAIMCALQESSLRILNHGDAVGRDSRGLYQQRDPWGPLSVRMDIAGSTRLFLRDGPTAVRKVSPNYASATGKELGQWSPPEWCTASSGE